MPLGSMYAKSRATCAICDRLLSRKYGTDCVLGVVRAVLGWANVDPMATCVGNLLS